MSVTRARVATVLDKYPTLNCYGMTVLDDADAPDLAERRADLLTPRGVRMVARSLDWLNENPCWRGGSYGGKHKVEHDTPFGVGDYYISNGAFIVAAILSGRKMTADHNPEISPAVGYRCRAGKPIRRAA